LDWSEHGSNKQLAADACERHGEGEASAPSTKEKLLASSGVVVLVAAGALAWIYRDSLLTLRDDIARLGHWGVLVFVLVFVLWSLTTIPAIPLMAFSGLLFGIWQGTLWSALGATIGAAATFWIGRMAARDRVQTWRCRYGKLGKVMDLVEEHPVVSVVLVRVVAVFPLTLLNYGFGTTTMKFWRYIAVSSVMTLPGVALYSGFGHVLQRRLAGESISPLSIAWLVGFAGAGIVLALLARRYRARYG
jgi:uncharacterized membrane protein YdjX (TVP38/TMEM64 family)